MWKPDSKDKNTTDMLKFEDLNNNIQAVIFELDDVLYPQKDYDLQVFYLFANFLEYLEQYPPANDVIEFMSKRYEAHGSKDIFKETSRTFGIDEKYEENFNSLYVNAKLPLKLLLYKEVLAFLQELVVNRKQIYIVTKGNPQKQFNKIKHLEWNGLENYLKVYYVEEFNGKLNACIAKVLEDNQLEAQQVNFVGLAKHEEDVNLIGMGFIPID